MKTPSLLVGALLAGAALAGCSAPAPAPAPAASVQPAASATPTPTLAAPGAQVDANALLDAVGAASATIKTSTTDMTITSLLAGKPVPVTMKAQIDATTPSLQKISLVMTASGQQVEMVLDGTDYYLRMAALGEKWIKTTQADLEQQGQAVPDVSDQGAMLSKLKPSVKKVVYVGEEEVAGVRTRHYTITVDGKALAEANGTEPAKAPAEVPYELWLDQANLTRKFVMNVTDDDGGKVTMEGVVTSYNEPVTITVPDASQVTTLPR